MKTILIVLCSMITVTSLAQTKLIAFKSHSGNMANFSIALENELFSNEESNFGNPPFKTVRKLDSVIYLSPTAVILIKKEYRYPWSTYSKDSIEFIGTERDTVYNDLLFSS